MYSYIENAFGPASHMAVLNKLMQDGVERNVERIESDLASREMCIPILRRHLVPPGIWVYRTNSYKMGLNVML